MFISLIEDFSPIPGVSASQNCQLAVARARGALLRIAAVPQQAFSHFPVIHREIRSRLLKKETEILSVEGARGKLARSVWTLIVRIKREGESLWRAVENKLV